MFRVAERLCAMEQADPLAPRYRHIDPRGKGSRWLSVVHFAWAVAQILAFGATGRASALHVMMGDRGSALRKSALVHVARIVGMPCVVHLHAADLGRVVRPFGWTPRCFVQGALRRADACIVLGSRGAALVRDRAGVLPARIAVIRNGVPEPSCTRAVAGPGAVSPCVLFVGNLLERKGVDDLLRALARPELRERRWKACFVGGGPIGAFRERADRLDLRGRIEFTGWLPSDAVSERLCAASVLVLPSYDEGLPLVIIEAFARRVPVITTPVGEIPDEIVGERHALLVDPGDVAMLAAAVVRVLDDPGLASRLASEARVLYEDRFTETAFAMAVRRVYRDHCGAAFGTDEAAAADASPGRGRSAR